MGVIVITMISVVSVAGVIVSVPGCAKRTVPSSRDSSPGSPNSEPPTEPARPRSGDEALRPPVSGSPRPTAVCGHAVAMAGWHPSDTTDDTLAICDPADNGLTGVDAHDWNPRPRRLPVHYGRRRPTVVLLPAAPFTITGAVVVSPRETSLESAASATAEAIPDLTQHLDPLDGGLCGAVSAADLLFSVAGRSRPLLPAMDRGPSARADAAVRRLIAGGGGDIRDAGSLAGRMGIAVGGAGATNEGIRAGLEGWLEQAAPGSWRVALDWLDDTEKTQSGQRAFFGRLATAIASGGGAILCMWPGTEFADGAVSAASEEHVAAEAVATPPAPPAPSVSAPPAAPRDEVREASFPGRQASGRSPAESARDAAAALREGRRLLAAGDAVAALASVGEAIEAARPHAAGDATCRGHLEDAHALARQVESRIARPRPGTLGKPTAFE